VNARPFHKYPGGKTDLLPVILPLMPRTYDRYFEPFCGAAAAFYALEPAMAHLNDASPEVTTTMRVVRDNVEELISELSNGSYIYDRSVYYSTREHMNGGACTDVERAAAFVYITRCGFNGLWRVNRQGHCDVPFGKYTNPRIVDPELLRSCSLALRGATITCKDFAEAMSDARAGDLVYIDSPYVPTSDTSSFTAYTAAGFEEADHRRLAAAYRALARRGVHCALSNSDTPLTRDLYHGFRIVDLSRVNSINCKGSKRQRVGEILVLSGTWEAPPCS
jgi:DNA adenine methylase